MGECFLTKLAVWQVVYRIGSNLPYLCFNLLSGLCQPSFGRDGVRCLLVPIGVPYVGSAGKAESIHCTIFTLKDLESITAATTVRQLLQALTHLLLPCHFAPPINKTLSGASGFLKHYTILVSAFCVKTSFLKKLPLCLSYLILERA